MSDKKRPKRRDVEHDIAYLTTEGEWFAETNISAYMVEEIARAHGRRLLEIAQRLRNAIAIDVRAHDRDTPSNQENATDDQ